MVQSAMLLDFDSPELEKGKKYHKNDLFRKLIA